MKNKDKGIFSIAIVTLMGAILIFIIMIFFNISCILRNSIVELIFGDIIGLSIIGFLIFLTIDFWKLSIELHTELEISPENINIKSCYTYTDVTIIKKDENTYYCIKKTNNHEN